jgi:hypothetical protein
MTGTDNKTLARLVLEEIFPADDEDTLREVISDRFVNHEAHPERRPGWARSRCSCTCSTMRSASSGGRSTT